MFQIRKITKNLISNKYKKNIFISNIYYSNILSILFLRNLNIKIVLIERTPFQELSIFFSLIDLIKKYSAEYIDFYSYGMKSNYIIKAGFINRKKYQNLIIPEYFEPFVKKNIDLMYGYKTSIKYPLVRLFKADGDRDRPSFWKNKQIHK